ncbi:MAG: HAMP domain-containing histidine kinase [Dysgonamonadaceae bacterium]|jgi:two-component system phosphate regulon sensor histidine kinase PhoR|nr:HAMP domain-containing histidine kinase [Dysgonamonadaceae bacterium]
MKKSTIWVLAIVMFVALFALLYLQVGYMRESITIRTQQFDEQVRRSLYQVMRNLELDQAREYLEQDIIESEARYLQHYGQLRGSTGIIERTSVAITHPDGSETRIEQQHIAGQPIGQSRTIARTQSDLQQALSQRFRYERALVDEVILSLITQPSHKPIEERIDFNTLNLYIQNELANVGLRGTPFGFQVLNFNNQAVYTSPNFSTRYQEAVFSQVLFPNDPPGRVNRMRVYFPTKRDYIRDELAFLAPSLIFTFILLITFIFTIIILFRQKRLSEMKNDFINNMTHELKTPVSTISLATQMLKDNSILKSPEVFKHVTGVINDETKRLSFQVEKVLQMSLFDRQKSTLKLKEIDVNDVVVSVANTHVLKVEKYGGTLDIDLEATESAVRVDEMHFTNVLFNLLDNAIKYRKEDVPLELMIRTRNEGNRLIVSVEDNGIGISREDAKKVFERFYRVHTGNRHDVKGFGLGLAYVKKIVNDLNGTIRVEGELGKGTKFIISLPTIIHK